MHKFLHLPFVQWRVLISSIVLLWAIRVGLWALPFKSLWRIVSRMTPAFSQGQLLDRASVDQVVWAVREASRYVPAATCLTQALAVKVLLGKRGQAAGLRLGVARSEAGEFCAHAWLECGGKVVIGGIEDLSRFTPLPSLEGNRS